MYVFALFAMSSAGKIYRSDYHSFGAENGYAVEENEGGWDDEEWPSEPLKPLKQWQPEPIVLKKKVPVYVPGI